MTIYKKILAVQQEATTIPKSGYNAFNKYKYSTEADVLAVKDLMNKHGLVAFPDVVGYETIYRGEKQEQVQVIQHIEYTVVDAETGESIKVKVLGQGEDKGDKAAYKAATGANKYFYLKFAGCATGDDPENDSKDKETKAAKPQLVKSQPAPVSSPIMQGILALMKQHNLSKEAVMQIAKVDTLKGLSEPQLKEVYDCIHFAMQEAN